MATKLKTANGAGPSVKHREQLGELACSPYFDAVVAANRLYLTAAVADPFSTEESHWALSCMPATNDHDRFSTISMRNMETFVLRRPQDNDDRIRAFIIVSGSVLNSFGDDFDHRGLKVAETKYDSADDVIYVAGDWAVLAPALSSEPLRPAPLRAAARALADQLLRSGRTSYSRYHNRGLAAHALGRI